MKKTKLKLKNRYKVILKVIGVLVALALIAWGVYNYELSTITKLGYSREASINILFKGKKSYVVGLGIGNKTLNKAFESEYYIEENLDSYSKIIYQDHEHLIQNINNLISKGYSNNDISMIFSHGSDEDVIEFAKKDKIRYLEEFYIYDYAKIKYYDRYIKYCDDTGEDEETAILFVNLGMDEDDYTNARKVEKFSSTMLVNKHFVLDKDFVPEGLVVFDEKYTNGEEQMGNGEAVKAFGKMWRAAKAEGLGLVINSSYRSYEDQEDLCDYYRKVYGKTYVERYVAFPGYSEHQTGLAFDIGSTSSNVFAKSKEYPWMLENAYKYGFILRYSEKNINITGFREEPWHYRYVGEETAKYIYENKLTLEEYYVQFLND